MEESLGIVQRTVAAPTSARSALARRALIASVAVVVLGACSAGRAYPLDPRIGLIAQFKEFNVAPAGADLVSEVRRHGCEEPDSGASPPSITRTYQVKPEDLDRTVAAVRDKWEQQGWVRDVSPDLPAYYSYRKVTSAGWTAGLNLYAPSGTTISVQGEVEDALLKC